MADTVLQSPSVSAAGDKAPALEETDVTAWLREQHAGHFAEEFYEAGYLNVAEVDDDAVGEIVGSKEKGTARRLSADLERRARGPMVPPDLPPGTSLDLSKPEQTIEDKHISFSVPSALSVERTNAAIQSPNALRNEEWVVIAHNSALLYGFSMDGPAPTRARKPVLEWVVPEGYTFARSEMFQARVESVVSYSEETATYVSCGFDKESATAAFPFCAASFERSRKERNAEASKTKELYVVGKWKYPRATLFLDECTQPSQAFKQAIESALQDKDPPASLHAVFDNYGHAVPQEVTLGGVLYFKHVRTEVEQIEEKKVEQEYRAAVEAKYQGFSGSAGFAAGTATSDSAESRSIADETSFDVLGGDATAASSPSQWAPSVKDPQLWAAIDNARLCSPIDLLDDTLRNEVLSILPIPPQYSQLPAIEAPLKKAPNEVSDAATAGFLTGLVEAIDVNDRGSVLLTSGRQTKTRQDDSPPSFAAEANVHHDPKNDLRIQTSSVCLPVAFHSDYGVWTDNDHKRTSQSVGFAKTRFDFGEWSMFDIKQPPFPTAQAGFLALSIEAAEGTVADVIVKVDGQKMAAASAHHDPRVNAYQMRAALCIPVPANSTVDIDAKTFKYELPFFTKLMPSPKIRIEAGWIPIAPGWTMGGPVKVEANTRVTAETDGLLYGSVAAETNGARGYVRLSTASVPWVGASVHYYQQHLRFVRYASAMLPIGRGTEHMASFTPTAAEAKPVPTFWWTPISEDPTETD